MSTKDTSINNIEIVTINGNLEDELNTPDSLSNDDISFDKNKKSDEFSIATKEELLYNEFIEKLTDHKNIHVISAAIYEKRNFGFVIPTIIVTAIGSIISFLSASSFFNENTRVILGITVGIIAIFSSVLQSFQSAFKYNTKAEMFRTAAEQYDRLIVKIKFELAKHNEKDFTDKFERKLLEIQNNCKYYPPQHVVDNYTKKKKLLHLKK